MFLRIHEVDPQPRQINTVIEVLRKGGVIIYPTDTIYGLGCDIHQPKAIERICRLKGIQPSKAKLSFICNDLSNLSEYAKQLPNRVYRLLKEYLPGPYTFVLPASKQVPKILKSKKDTIGLRIPDNIIARTIARELNNPILSTSLPGETAEEYADPELIYRNFENKVDLVIDGGIGGLVPSTVIDCTGNEPIMLRQGLGKWTI
ncbi:MAG TPA: L-threonylcarbamoyladenylate synthase [Chitinophagaceae bacterium]|nr:L-threonylcarbamoyladenylate synthase [Chitinophagaceae bacterium]